jgi:hypothetical protein
VSQRRDVTKIVTDFLKVGFTGRGGAIDLARTNPGWSAGTVAQAVQGSAYGSRYDDVGDQADAVIAAWGGVTSGGSITTAKKYEFTRGSPGKREDTWTAIRRLAAEVNWRCFVVGDAVYFIGDDDLFASRARFTLREDLGGVGDVSFDYDYGKKVAEATVTCRASRWIAPPGTVVILDDLGMADGRWLVGSIRRSLFDRQTEISLVKPMTPKPEPSAGTTSTTSNASGTPGRSGPVRTKLVEWARWAVAHKSEYFYSMQDAPNLPTLKHRPVRGYRFDCSWFVTLLYKQVGAPDPNGTNYAGGNTASLRAHGTKVEHPLPGDLVHYGSGAAGGASHVALYIGDGKAIGIGSNASGVHEHDAKYRSDFAGYWRNLND